MEVHQNIFETKCPFGVDDDGNLLTYLMDTTIVAMVTGENKWQTLIGEWVIRKMALVESC